MKANKSQHKTKKEASPPENAVAPRKEFSPEEMARLRGLSDKLKKNQAPKFQLTPQGVVTVKGDDFLNIAGLLECFATTSREFADRLVNQIMVAAPGDTEQKVQHLNASLAIFHGIKPRDEIESLLLAQMTGTHNAAMEYFRRAMLPDQTVDGVTANNERATKMLRTFTTQMEALNRYRGKGQQKVTVEHVTVNSGGQAIVGQVNQTRAVEPEGGDKSP